MDAKGKKTAMTKAIKATEKDIQAVYDLGLDGLPKPVRDLLKHAEDLISKCAL